MELAVVVAKDKFLSATSRSLNILVKFLTDDIGFRKIDSVVEWIKNDNYSSSVLNASYLVKHKNKINIYFFYDGYGRGKNKGREKFEISKDGLINVIEKWSEHIKGPFSGLVISVENGVVNLESMMPM